MHFISDVFGGGGEAAADRNLDWLKKIPGVFQDHLGAYEKAGTDTLPGYQKSLQGLTDPNSINNMMKNYQPSDYYKFQTGEAGRAAANAGAAGGQLGTGDTQAQLAKIIQGLASGDQNQYLQNVFHGLGMGLAGQEGLINGGRSAATTSAQGTADAYAGIGGMEGQKRLAEANRNQGIFGGITNFLQNNARTGANVAGGVAGGAAGGGGPASLFKGFM